jgi:hypothetical protein
MYSSFSSSISSLLECLYGKVQYGGYTGLCKTSLLFKEGMPL